MQAKKNHYHFNIMSFVMNDSIFLSDPFVLLLTAQLNKSPFLNPSPEMQLPSTVFMKFSFGLHFDI